MGCAGGDRAEVAQVRCCRFVVLVLSVALALVVALWWAVLDALSGGGEEW